MNLAKEDRIISEFLKSLGPWNKYVSVGGGYALFIYKLYLSDQNLGSPPIATNDIDSLIPRRVPLASKKNIAKHLNDAGFTPIFKDLDIPATESYVKEVEGSEIEIEFLTDSATRSDRNKNVMVSGVVAQPLSYLTLSLQTTVEFQTYSKQSGRVVSPGAWMFHKGLTYTRRNSRSKSLKDLYGIWYVTTQLGSYSTQAIHEFIMLSKKYSKWFDTFRKNLSQFIKKTSPIEWSEFESQDPEGKLKKLHFERAINHLM